MKNRPHWGTAANATWATLDRRKAYRGGRKAHRAHLRQRDAMRRPYGGRMGDTFEVEQYRLARDDHYP